jgi:integrase
MQERIKYVTARPSLKNPKRWYWQRKGFDLVALSNDPVERFAQATKLNKDADGQAVLVPGSIGWVVQQYRESDEYKALRSGTKKYYDRILADVEALKASLPFSAFTRKAVILFVNTYKAGMRKQVGAVLINLFNLAIYHEYATENYARKLRLKSSPRRTQTFSEAECKSWIAACDDATMLLAFTILRYAVQRPGDVLAMKWSQYNGDSIRLRQEKTGAYIEVPCHTDLRAALDEAKKTTRHINIVSEGLKALRYSRFCVRFRRIANAAGLKDHQARDLRRTATVRMAEAGATVPEIAGVGGWTIDYTTQILETYLPRNVEIARGGILKWERKSNNSSNGV